MRFELAGTIAPPTGPPGPGNPSNPSEGFLSFTYDATLDLKSYGDQGYTAIEIICIGAGGGQGGGYYAPTDHTPFTDSSGNPLSGVHYYTGRKYYGGAGGGGGLQRVAMNLADLPDSVEIKVGQVGAPGTWFDAPSRLVTGRADGPENTSETTDGGDGGYSSFNGMTCCASGGKGGKRVQQANWWPEDNDVQRDNIVLFGPRGAPLNDGGDGGVGGSIVAGGGGAGAKQRIDSPYTKDLIISNSVNAQEGTWSPETGVGHGGGGGFGGVTVLLITDQDPYLEIDRYLFIAASFGADGNYSDSDVSAMGPRSEPIEDPEVPYLGAPIAGPGGGACAAVLAGLGDTNIYGTGPQVTLVSPGQLGSEIHPPADTFIHHGFVAVQFTAK